MNLAAHMGILPAKGLMRYTEKIRYSTLIRYNTKLRYLLQNLDISIRMAITTVVAKLQMHSYFLFECIDFC